LLSWCVLSIHRHPCQGEPPPSNLSSRPERRDLQCALMEKRNPEATCPRRIRLCPKVKLQVPPLRDPGFPVRLSGVDELHDFPYGKPHRFLGWVPRCSKSGAAPVGMTNLRTVAHLGMGGGGWTELSKDGPYTQPVPTLRSRSVNDRRANLDKYDFQSSLRDWSQCGLCTPGLTSWAILSRPFGTGADTR
jgi:hypothetical protein